MKDYVNIVFSVAALSISLVTLWLTRFKRGFVKMTRPSLIAFGTEGEDNHPKIFIRTLLYSTSDKGQYIENMFVKLQGESFVQNFDVWAYVDNNRTVRGSGLFISRDGISCNHHFLAPKRLDDFNFLSGNYLLSIYVEVVGKKSPKLIFEQSLTILKDQEEDMIKRMVFTLFDWATDKNDYVSYTDFPPKH